MQTFVATHQFISLLMPNLVRKRHEFIVIEIADHIFMTIINLLDENDLTAGKCVVIL